MAKNYGPNRVPAKLPKKRKLGSSDLSPRKSGGNFGQQKTPPKRASRTSQYGPNTHSDRKGAKTHPGGSRYGQPSDSKGYSQRWPQKDPGYGGSD